jgi:hypothetical protein
MVLSLFIVVLIKGKGLVEQKKIRRIYVRFECWGIGLGGYFLL